MEGVKVRKIKVPVEDKRWEYPIHDGMMRKQGSKFPSWKDRYFILTLDGDLFYFKKKTDVKPIKEDPIVIRGMKFCRTDKKPNCIKVERHPKPFYFRAKDSSTMLKWMEQLSIAGGIRQLKEFTSASKKKVNGAELLPGAPEISVKDLSRWSTKDVQTWMKLKTFENNTGDKFSMYSKNFEKMNVSGKEMEKFREKHLINMEIENKFHRKKMMKAINEIRSLRVFNWKEFKVYEKIVAMTEKVGKCKNANWTYLAKSLSDPVLMQETYLNPSMLEEAFSRMMGEESDEELFGDENMEDDDFSKETTIEAKLPEVDSSQTENVSLQEERKLPVKLVITEMVRSDAYKTARKLLSPVLDKIPRYRKEFGIFHTAIIIGPWYLEWNDSSLIIPRTLYSGMALLTADIDNSTQLQSTSIDEVTEKLSEVVCRWNTTMKYTNLKNQVSYGNCQQFVEDVMEALAISFERGGAFAKFLDEMRKSGHCKMTFSPSEEFMTTYDLRIDKITFESHEELDDFVIDISKINEIKFQMDYKEEYRLLKRAFWLRHFKDMENEKFKPSSAGCKFQDPRKTKSLMRNYS